MAFIEYPKMKFYEDGKTRRIVQSHDEEMALDGAWGNGPAGPFEKMVKPIAESHVVLPAFTDRQLALMNKMQLIGIAANLGLNMDDGDTKNAMIAAILAAMGD